MLKKGKTTQDKKSQYIRKDSSFNIRELVMRTPTSTSPDRSPELYTEEKQTQNTMQDLTPQPTPVEILKAGNEKLEDLIYKLSSFDVSTIQRRSDPRMKALSEEINGIIAEIFGRNTEEYDDNSIWTLDTLPITIGGSWYPLPEVREGYQKGIHLAIKKINSLLGAQEKKLEAFIAGKPVLKVLQEPTVNTVITDKEKVSLVSLRGKHRNKEISILNHTKPTNGNGAALASIFAEGNSSEDSPKQAYQKNNFSPIRTERKEISDINDDQESSQVIPQDHKKAVLLEKLEENLKKLQEEMPFFGESEEEDILLGNQELYITPILKGPEKELIRESNLKKEPLAGLTAKLNKIISSEPEYTGEYTKKVLDNDEEMPLFEAEDYTPVVGNEQMIRESFVKQTEGEPFGLESGNEVLVINGDNVLSSAPNFTEVLGNDHGTPEVSGRIQEKVHLDNTRGIEKRVSLEALEAKLREFEENNVSGNALASDLLKTEDEEILLIEDTGELSEEMINEFAREPFSTEVVDERFRDEEVLVIDGDEDLSHEPVSLESVEENSQEELLIIDGDNAFIVDDISLKAFPPEDSYQQELFIIAGLNEDGIVRQDTHKKGMNDKEILVIERDTGLPEDVADGLPIAQDLYENQEGEPPGLAKSFIQAHSLDGLPVRPDADRQSIIILLSQATLLDGASNNVVAHTMTILLEDLELRLRDFNSLQPDQVYFNTDLFYVFDETVALSGERELNKQSKEKNVLKTADLDIKQPEDMSMVTFFEYDFLTGTPTPEKIIEPMVNVAFGYEISGFMFAKVAHTKANIDSPPGIIEEVLTCSVHDDQIQDVIVENGILELTETIIYGEISNQESWKVFLPVEWEEIQYYEATTDPTEDALSAESVEQVSHEYCEGNQSFEELSVKNLPKDMANLSDQEHETLIAATVDVLNNKVTLPEAFDEMISWFEAEETELFMVDGSPDITNDDNNLPVVSGNKIPEEVLFVVSSDELIKDVAKELATENEIALITPEEENIAHESNVLFQESITINEHEEDGNDITDFSEMVFSTPIETNESVNLGPDIDQDKLDNFITKIPEIDELTQVLELTGITLPGGSEVFASVPTESIEGFKVGEYEISDEHIMPDIEEGLLSFEAFEKVVKDTEKDSKCNSLEDDEFHELSRDSILLEALEEMLSNLATNASKDGNDQPNISVSQPKDEKVLVVHNYKEPPKKPVLIKTGEERSNPFAVNDSGKEKTHSKVLHAGDLQAQIGELRCRIDDLKSFDIESIEQRFDPRVRTLGDTVNNTIADIFGRNTSAYWQHALPSLDSLPVVVGGPKFSPEELRDAYLRRINDAISKVNITIDTLEAKLSKLEDKGACGQLLFFAPKISKYSDIQSLR